MAGDSVLIIDTGVANIASLLAAFERVGRPARLTDSPGSVRSAAHVVLPGVGAFGAGMERLASAGLDEALRQRIGDGAPTLAVCLGLQLLCEASEESPGVAGLGVVEAQVMRFGDGVRVPQFGWNQVEPASDAALLRPGYAYFANSYRLGKLPDGWTGATADHGGPFVAALERGGLLACQFHPELSGHWGSELLQRWLDL